MFATQFLHRRTPPAEIWLSLVNENAYRFLFYQSVYSFYHFKFFSWIFIFRLQFWPIFFGVFFFAPNLNPVKGLPFSSTFFANPLVKTVRLKSSWLKSNWTCLKHSINGLKKKFVCNSNECQVFVNDCMNDKERMEKYSKSFRRMYKLYSMIMDYYNHY